MAVGGKQYDFGATVLVYGMTQSRWSSGSIERIEIGHYY